ncbi:MAG: hypothetical protein WAM14_03975 [Candidatus Nitrosopolaris sp.]
MYYTMVVGMQLFVTPNSRPLLWLFFIRWGDNDGNDDVVIAA